MTRTASRLVLLGVIAPVISGCGSASPASIAPADAARLHADVASVRSAAAAGHRDAARAAVAALREEISSLQRSGRLDGADAAALQAGAAQAQAQLPAAPATTSTPGPSTPAPAATPTATSPPAPAGPGKAHGKGHGKGHGDGGNQGDGGD